MEKNKMMFEDGKRIVLAGIVKDAEVRTKEGVKKACIKLHVDDQDILVFFGDKTDSTKTSEKPATRVEKLKIKSGTLMMVVGYLGERDGKEYINGVDFMVYSGFKTGFKTSKGAEVTFLLGIVCNGQMTQSKNGEHDIFKVSVPVNRWVNGEKKCDWYQVAFFDKAAEHASDYFKNNKRPAVIRCSALNNYESPKTGNITHNLIGYDFVPAPLRS